MASRPIRLRRVALAGFLTVAGILGAAAPASAHADLVNSSPAASAVLETAPDEISLDFTEPISAIEGSIELFAASGDRIDIGSAQVDGSDPARLVAANLPNLETGQYVVAWRVLSADGHVAEGAFSFLIGADGLADADAVADVVAGLAAERESPSGLGAVRYGARLGVFFGVCVLLGTLAVAVGAGRSVRSLRSVLVVGWILASVGTAMHFATQGPYAVGGSWSGIVDTGLWNDVWSTRNGRALVARLILLIIVAGLLELARRSAGRTATPWWRSSVALVGAGIIVTMAAAGHPSSSSLAGVAVGVDAVHLSAIVIWVGGLLVLALSRPADADDATRLAGQFSRAATVAVPIAVLTGLWQTWHLVPSWDDLTESSWGRALVVKTAFVVAAVTVGGVARWMVVNSLGASIRRLVVIEVVVVAGILGSTAALVANPPRVVAEPAVFTASLAEGTTIVNVTVTPGRVGVNETHLTVQTPAGALAPVEDVTVRFSQVGSEVPPLEVPLEILGPNHFTGSVSLLAAGSWTMEVLVQVDESSVTRLSTSLEIAG